MSISHKLSRLERHAPKPPHACLSCGFASFRNGTGTGRPGWLLPDSVSDECRLLECKTCFA